MDFDETHDEVYGFGRAENLTDIIRPPKSILKVRENTTLPIANGVSVDRRVSFAEKVKLHKIDFVPVELAESPPPPELSSSEEEDLSFSNLEADADKVLTALGNSLSNKMIQDPEFMSSTQDAERPNFYDDLGEKTMDFTGPLPRVDLSENKNFKRPGISENNSNLQTKDSNFGKGHLNSENDSSDNENPADLEEDMELTGQVQVTQSQKQLPADSAKEETMDLTELYAGPASVAGLEEEETMDFTQHAEPHSETTSKMENGSTDNLEEVSKKENDPSKETLEEPLEETPEETLEETLKEIPEETLEENSKEIPNEASNESSNESSAINFEKNPEERLEENPEERSKDSSQDAGLNAQMIPQSEEEAEPNAETGRSQKEAQASEIPELSSEEPKTETPSEKYSGNPDPNISSSDEFLSPDVHEDNAGAESETGSVEKDIDTEQAAGPETRAEKEHSRPEINAIEQSHFDNGDHQKHSDTENHIDFDNEETVMELTQPIPAPGPSTPPHETRMSEHEHSLPDHQIIPLSEKHPLESIQEQTEDDTSYIGPAGSQSDRVSQEEMQPKRHLEAALETSPKRFSPERPVQHSQGSPQNMQRYVQNSQRISPQRLSQRTETTTIPLSEANDPSDDEYPVLSLEEFLQDIGIKFYDDLEIATDLSSQYRFSTPSQEHFDSAEFYRANISIPLLEVYELSCKELAAKISQGKLLFKELQQKTLQDNPDLFRQYQKASFYEKVAMKSQFHLMRELTRQQAKQVWYEWRAKLFQNIIEVFQTNLNILQEDRRILRDKMSAAEQKSTQTRRKLHELRMDIARFKAMMNNFKTLEAEQIQSIKARMVSLNTQLSEQRDVISARKKAISVVQRQIQETNENIAAVEKQVAKTQAELNNTRHFDELEIAGLQTEAKVLEACAGLKYLSSPGAQIYEFEFNSKMSIIIDASQPESTEGLLFRPKDSASPVLFNDSLMQKCQYLAENTSFSNIYDTLRDFREKWSKLLLLDEHLHRLSMKYPVRIDTSRQIDFEVDLFVFSKGLKVTLLGSVPVDTMQAYPKTVTWSARVHGSGMAHSDVKQTICECKALAHFPTLASIKIQ